MALDAKKFTIRIESILGGLSTYENFGGNDQFQSALGIDPDLPSQDQSGSLADRSFTSSGFIRPSGSFNPASEAIAHITNYPLWLVPQPKNSSNTYIYDVGGSVYTYDGTFIQGLGDLNDGGTATGNGAEYYDNYIYFSRSTTVARYGPLDGTPSFTDDYWVATLGKTALNTGTDVSNGLYPAHPFMGTLRFPNHQMIRHSDGKLYFADVVNNQGVLHCISTTKTTVEGDTDNGSTFNAVDFPFGMYISALASYGDKIAVALYEGTGLTTLNFPSRARVAIWDPTNPLTYDLLTDDEFPDPYISAMLNSNGVLYTWSCEFGILETGVRILRYVGGKSFEQVGYLDYVYPPMPGAVDGRLNKIVFGTHATDPVETGCVYAIGQKKSPVSNAIFNIMNVSTTTSAVTEIGGFPINSDVSVTALKFARQYGLHNTSPLVGWARRNPSAGLEIGFGLNSSTDGGWYAESIFRSQVFRLGRPFKITKLSIPILTSIDASSVVTPILFMDGQSTTYEQEDITSANYGSSEKLIVQRPTNATGKHNFFLSLDWTPSDDLLTVGLPIIIDGEYIDE